MSQQLACCAATSATPSRICDSQPVWGHRTDIAGLRGYWGLPSAGASPRTIVPDHSLRHGMASRRSTASGSLAASHAADLGEVAANRCQLGEHWQHPPAVGLPAGRTIADCLHALFRDLPGCWQPGWPTLESLPGTIGKFGVDSEPQHNRAHKVFLACTSSAVCQSSRREALSASLSMHKSLGHCAAGGETAAVAAASEAQMGDVTVVDSRQGGSAAAAEVCKAPSAMAAARAALKTAGKLSLKHVCLSLAGSGAQNLGSTCSGGSGSRACEPCGHDRDTCKQLPLLTCLLRHRQRCCILGE